MFDPEKSFKTEINVKKLTVVADAKKVKVQRAEVEKHRSTGSKSSNLIGAFNEQIPVEGVLVQAVYDQKGINEFRHPNSESKSFGATVKDGRVNSLNEGDPLATGKGSHDAFSAFTILNHNGDITAALRAAGDMVTIGNESWNTVAQREYAKTHPITPESLFSDVAEKPKQSPLETIRSLSMTNKIDEIKADLENDFFVIDGMALGGQISLFYAKPGTGKTLFFFYFLIEAIKKDKIDPSKVFYVNADDNFKGLYHKALIARNHNFQMLSPANSGMAPSEIIDLLDQLSQTDDAKGTIIILDTLKKFADMMNKRSLSDLFLILRKLVAKNATVIIAGHANKNLSPDGELIYEGTSDVLNDIDCAYSMYQIDKGDSEFVVEFRNEKARGDVLAIVSYGYSKVPGMSYMELIESIYQLDDAQTTQANELLSREQLRDKYKEQIDFVRELLEIGDANRTQILTKFKLSNVKFSRRSLIDALKKMDRIEWHVKVGSDKNEKVYTLFSKPPTMSFL